VGLQNLRDSFKLAQYVLVTRVFTDPSAPAPEDEFYHKHCSWSYTFPITSKEVAKDELQPLRMVLSMTPQQVTAARKELSNVVGNFAQNGS